MPDDSTRQRFAAALDSLVDRVKQDRSILAALLCGSLSHDTVWARSDIDLVLVTIDDRKVQRDGLSLYAEGVNVHANLVPRAEFRRMVEGSVRHSFAHAFLARGRLLYTQNPTIAALCATLADLGGRDAGIQLLRAATHALRRSTRRTSGSSHHRAAALPAPRRGGALLRARVQPHAPSRLRPTSRGSWTR